MAIKKGSGGDDDLTRLTGTSDADVISGLAGDDQLRGEAGDDLLDGGAGFDQARYETSPAGIVVTFDTSTQTYSVEDGFGFTDTLISIERIRGSTQNDTFIGGNGADQFTGNGGNDLINGGGGSDTALYTTSPAGVVVNLGLGTASDGFGGTDTLISIERVRGSDHNDTITGDGGENVILGGAGNDVLSGGAGVDDVGYFTSTAPVTVNLQTGTASDGFGGTDTLTQFEGIVGSEFGDTLIGSNGAQQELFNGGMGADSINGGGGSFDELNYSDSPRGVTVNLSIGEASDGWGFTDTFSNIEGIEGSQKADILTGDANNNTIDGRGGGDTIDGGDGFDVAEFNQSLTEISVNLSDSKKEIGYGVKLTLISIEGIVGSDLGDSVTGSNVDNYFFGRSGSDFFDGRGGIDTADYDANSGDFDIAVENGTVTVEDLQGDIDSYVNVEFLEFNDVTIATADLLA